MTTQKDYLQVANTDEPEIVNRAMRDYRLNRVDYKNPYPSGTQGYNAYERGWMQALKRDDSRPFTQTKSPLPVVQSAPKTEVNLYALMKGRSGPRK
jgi:hypothetical protein